ncbi:hypothetical protein RYX36_032180 [Vicia faba]
MQRRIIDRYKHHELSRNKPVIRSALGYPAFTVGTITGTPESNFYPLSDGPSTRHRRITKADFRPCSTGGSCSQAPFCLCTRGPISVWPEETFARLRYLLGGLRPIETVYLRLSLGLSWDKVVRIFTDMSISPSLSPRQCPDRYAFRAGRNLPDKEFRYLRTVIVTAAVHRGFGRRLPCHQNPIQTRILVVPEDPATGEPRTKSFSPFSVRLFALKNVAGHPGLEPETSPVNPSVADHPLGPATDHRLGKLLPHQLANQTQAPPWVDSSFRSSAYGVLAAVSSCCPPPKGRSSKGSQRPTKARKPDSTKDKTNPLYVLRQAIRGVTPNIGVKARRVSESTHQVPIEIGSTQGKALAIRWLLAASRKRPGRNMAFKLSSELVDAAKGSGDAIRKKEETQRMAEANRILAHFR